MLSVASISNKEESIGTCITNFIAIPVSLVTLFAQFGLPQGTISQPGTVLKSLSSIHIKGNTSLIFTSIGTLSTSFWATVISRLAWGTDTIFPVRRSFHETSDPEASNVTKVFVDIKHLSRILTTIIRHLLDWDIATVTSFLTVIECFEPFLTEILLPDLA